MEILQLRYFFLSAKNENFSTTAKLYGVPTTAVSSSVRRLEKEIGCDLFDRTHNSIRLNSKGMRLQQALCVVFAELDRAVEELSAQYQDKREIKVLVRGMRRKVTNLLSEFSITHPHIAFKIIFHQSSDTVYDVIIDDSKDCYSGYQKFELYSMCLRLKCAAKDPLCKRQLSMRELCDRTFVAMDQDSNMHRILTDACLRSGFHPNIAAFCNDIECYEKLITMGIGIGIGREDPNSDAGSGRTEICDLNVADFHERYTVYAYYRESDYFGTIKKPDRFYKTKCWLIRLPPAPQFKCRYIL